MGTGVVSLLLYSLPYPAPWLYYLSIAVFCLNILLFAIFLLLSLLRYTLYPSLWLAMVRHPAQSLFLGTFSMGFATILNMLVLVCVPLWGPWALTLAWALWWADALVALAVCATMPFIIMQVHRPELRSMSAAWLLPIVTTVVAAASGALVAGALGVDKPQHALWTLAVSYVLWGTGVSLAMSVLVIYFHRLVLYRIPPREVIVSVFLPLGPLGQGGYGAMLLGKVARAVFPLTGTLSAGETRAGDVLYVVGWVVAMVMWGYGLLWLFFAVASISRSRFPFNMGWWGFTFPLGVYGLCTIQLGREMPSMFFDVLGTVCCLPCICPVDRGATASAFLCFKNLPYVRAISYGCHTLSIIIKENISSSH